MDNNNNNNFNKNIDNNNKEKEKNDILYEDKDNKNLEIDRMVNEGLGGGYVSEENGLIYDTTTDKMDDEENEENNDELSDFLD